MEVSVLQAALIGISCWLGSVENSQPLGVAFSDGTTAYVQHRSVK